MEQFDFRMDQKCDNCGMVTLSMSSFEQVVYNKDGRVTIEFTCPRCGGPIKIAYVVGISATVAMVEAAMQTIDQLVESNDVRMDDAFVELDPDSPEFRDVETYNPDAPLPDFGSAQPAEGDGQAQAPHPDAKGGPQEIHINYMTMGSQPMMTYGIELNPSDKREPGDAGYSPTEEDEARMEYFHRQLEGLDTVDEAIDEIESGYKPNDPDESDDQS